MLNYCVYLELKPCIYEESTHNCKADPLHTCTYCKSSTNSVQCFVATAAFINF